MENLGVLEHGCGHVDEVGARLVGAEGGTHFLELAVVDEDGGQGLAVFVDLVLGFHSCGCDGAGGDVSVGGEKVVEELRDGAFNDACERVGDGCHNVRSEGFEDLVEEGALNVVCFEAFVEGRVVDAVVLCHSRTRRSGFMSKRRWKRGAIVRGIRDTVVVKSATGDATMAMLASTEIGWD